MLNLVPLAGTRWEMANMNPQTQVIRQILQGHFPQPTTTAVAAAAICCDQQLAGRSIARAAHFDPPSSDRFSRESCRIVINADAHPPLIFRDVVDTVWNGLAEILIHEVMNTNFLRAALWLPFTSVVFK